MNNFKDYINRHKTLILSIFSALCLTLLIILFHKYLSKIFMYIFNVDNMTYIKDLLCKTGFMGWIIMVLYNAARVILPFLPAQPFEILSGVMYGSFLGMINCMLGIILGSLVVFYIVNKFGNNLVLKLIKGEHISKYESIRTSKKIEIISFLIFLLPGTPKDTFTYIAAFTTLGLKKFLLFISIARIPTVLSLTVAGSNIIKGNLITGILIYAVTIILTLLGCLFHNKFLEKHSSKKLKNK